jgi:hypothetical protein
MSFEAATSALRFAKTISAGASAYHQGKAQAKQLKQSAQVNEINAKNFRNSAASDASGERRQGRDIAGRQAALFAASGIAFTGSAADVLEETAQVTEFNALTAMYDGEIRAVEQEYQAAINKYQAKISKRNAQNSLIGAFLSEGIFAAKSAYNSGLFSSKGGIGDTTKRTVGSDGELLAGIY